MRCHLVDVPFVTRKSSRVGICCMPYSKPAKVVLPGLLWKLSMYTDSSSQEPGPGWVGRWNQLSRQMRRQLGERYAYVGLSESRAAVLQALAHNPCNVTQADLANDLSLSESNLCSLVERMRTEGLLDRKRSSLDRRKTVLTLTSSGRASCLMIEQIHSEFTSALLLDLPQSMQDLLSQTFSELNRCLSRMETETSATQSRRAAS